jgi:site-specific DNA-methyltransferase (adenine-specific)
MAYTPHRADRESWRGVTVIGDGEPFDPSHLLTYPRAVLWGANWYADKLPPSGGWFVWDKTPRGAREGFMYSHCELAWTNLQGRIAKFSLEWNGSVRNHEGILHPTQKPVALMRWIIEKFTGWGDLVLDPYMGSGPVAQACHELGRKYIGIEIDEHYCEIAANRCRQEGLAI